jgi:hypothetical protein
MHLLRPSRIALMILAIAGIFITLLISSCSKPSSVATAPLPKPVESRPPTASEAPPPPLPPPEEVVVTGTRLPPRGKASAKKASAKKASAKKASAKEPSAKKVSARPPSLPTFPWPPPKPSSRVVVPSSAFNSARTFGDLAALLDKALLDSGYSEKSYWSVPDGIAEVMRLERTYADGLPAAGAQRWVINSSALQPLSITDYVKALFAADPGYYRVIAFVVTDAPFVANGAPITESGARALLTDGAVSLPPEYLTKPLPTGYNCTALVYEFLREIGKDPAELDPGHLDGKDHLVKSGIWAKLHLQ